jgi:hypothetical protein
MDIETNFRQFFIECVHLAKTDLIDLSLKTANDLIGQVI